jgi:hypothetical protein
MIQRKQQYLFGVLVFAPLWFIATFALMMKLLAAEDPGLPIGEISKYVDGHEIVSFDPNYKGTHQGEFPPVPSWLKVAVGIAYPIFYVLPENGFSNLSDHANGTLFLLMMFLNSILWGFALVFLIRFIARLFPVRKIAVTNTI